MNVLRLACLILSLAAVFPSETLGKDSAKSGSASVSRSGKSRARLDRALSTPSKLSGKTRVIIRHRSDKSDNVRSKMSKRGGRFLKNNKHGMVAEVSPSSLAELADDSDVLGISLDAPVSASQLTSLTSQTIDSYLAAFDSQATRKTLGIKLEDFGYDVGVAIIDSGIAPTPDVAPRISAFYDFTRGGIKTTPSDGYGHGTHIAGLIAGNGYSSWGKYVGVAMAPG